MRGYRYSQKRENLDLMSGGTSAASSSSSSAVARRTGCLLRDLSMLRLTSTITGSMPKNFSGVRAASSSMLSCMEGGWGVNMGAAAAALVLEDFLGAGRVSGDTSGFRLTYKDRSQCCFGIRIWLPNFKLRSESYLDVQK